MPMRVGELTASGRDCGIYADGSGMVVRRNRIGRSLEPEVRVMWHARSHGYPVPEVLDVDGPDMLMERLDGPNLLEVVPVGPGECGRTPGCLPISIVSWRLGIELSEQVTTAVARLS